MAIRAALLFLLVTAGGVEAAQLTPANALDRRQISELALSPAADRLAFAIKFTNPAPKLRTYLNLGNIAQQNGGSRVAHRDREPPFCRAMRPERS